MLTRSRLTSPMLRELRLAAPPPIPTLGIRFTLDQPPTWVAALRQWRTKPCIVHGGLNHTASQAGVVSHSTESDNSARARRSSYKILDIAKLLGVYKYKMGRHFTFPLRLYIENTASKYKYLRNSTYLSL